jgi:hypothetical protein
MRELVYRILQGEIQRRVIIQGNIYDITGSEDID